MSPRGSRQEVSGGNAENTAPSPGDRTSGKYHLRMSPELHASVAAAAAAEGTSLNQWIASTIGASLP